MAKGLTNGTSCINSYVALLNKKCKKETVRKYEGVLRNINDIVRDNGLSTNPRDYDEDTVDFLLNYWSDCAISTKKWYLKILNRYLKQYKNNVIEDMYINIGSDTRPNVNWLSREDYIRLLEEPKSALEEVVIHLELCMGLRVSEVLKLRIEDVHFDVDADKAHIAVLGKGHGEGKWRIVPFHPATEEVFKRWLEERAKIVRRVRDYNRMWTDPGTLLIWSHYVDKPDAGAYSQRGHSIDRAVIHVVRERTGINFTNHTLRRTFGHELYSIGTPIETISKLYGHEDIVTTVRYIGVNLGDMSDALLKMYNAQLHLSGSTKSKRED